MGEIELERDSVEVKRERVKRELEEQILFFLFILRRSSPPQRRR